MENVVDIEGQVKWLENIKISQLTNRSLMLASRLSHGIRRLNGEVIELNNQHMAACLGEQVVLLNDGNLNLLFRDFLEEVLSVNDSDYPTPSYIKTDGGKKVEKVIKV